MQVFFMRFSCCEFVSIFFSFCSFVNEIHNRYKLNSCC